jgi:hypothetical protein
MNGNPAQASREELTLLSGDGAFQADGCLLRDAWA